MLNQLRAANPHIEILETSHPSFWEYAMPVEAAPLESMFAALREDTAIPGAGNVYVAADEGLEGTAAFPLLRDNFYGGMPIQAGYCNGHNEMLNALEYHRGCEVTLAVSPFVLLLASYGQFDGGFLDSRFVKAYYVSEGEAFALYENTLHFSPCQVTPAGFKAGIVLPRGTNTPLDGMPPQAFGQDRMLFMRNKWLVAHPDSIQVKERGAFAGIRGENIRIIPVGESR